MLIILMIREVLKGKYTGLQMDYERKCDESRRRRQQWCEETRTPLFSRTPLGKLFTQSVSW